MKKKLNSILLVDDDESTNFFHKMIINKSDVTKNVVSVQSGVDALVYIIKKEDAEHPKPDIIFLDINMPAMNGWEFLEEYDKLQKEEQKSIVIIMLTTSLNPADKKKAEGIQLVSDYLNKPLTPEGLQYVIDKYFPDSKLEEKSDVLENKQLNIK